MYIKRTPEYPFEVGIHQREVPHHILDGAGIPATLPGTMITPDCCCARALRLGDSLLGTLTVVYA